MLYVEIVAVLFSFISVVFAVKGNIYTWISGIIGVLAYGVLFYTNGLYWNTALQVIFLIQSGIGLYLWKLDAEDNTNRLANTPIKPGVGIAILAICMLLLPLNAVLFENPVLMLDIQSSVLSVIALYYLINKKIATWYYWILANCCLILLFIHTEMYVSVALYSFFIVLNIIALFKWKGNPNYGEV